MAKANLKALEGFYTPKRSLDGQDVLLTCGIDTKLPAKLRCMPNPEYNRQMSELVVMSEDPAKHSDAIVNRCLADSVVKSLGSGKDKIDDADVVFETLQDPCYWKVREAIIRESAELGRAVIKAKTKVKKT